MKNYIAATGRFAVSLALLLLFMSAQANAQNFSRTLSLVHLSQELKTPQDVAFYIWRNFQFEKDRRQFGREEYWQSPAEILETRKGDCEDFALFAVEMLKLSGLKSFVINLYGSQKPHAVCVFKQNGKYGAIDGKNVIGADFNDLQALLNFLDPYWAKANIVEPTPSKDGRVMAEFSNWSKQRRTLASAS